MRAHLLLFGTLACFAASALADAIAYDVTVNTSSISGTAGGSLDFNFNPARWSPSGISPDLPTFCSFVGWIRKGTPTGGRSHDLMSAQI